MKPRLGVLADKQERRIRSLDPMLQLSSSAPLQNLNHNVVHLLALSGEREAKRELSTRKELLSILRYLGSSFPTNMM